MAKLPYYTSDTLIEAVKRKISFPIAQVTFSEEDILAFADEEMFLSQVPSILQYHEEYFVYTEDQALVANQSRYPIPTRAIGMKLRDVFYKDSSGQLIEMSRINPDDKAYLQTKGDTFPTPMYYYFQNNNVIISPEVGPSVTGSLQFSYYLRPNALVPNERAAVSTSFSKTVTIINASLVAGDTLTIGGEVITADSDFVIGGSSAVTASNLATFINTLSGLSATASNGVVTVTYQTRGLEFDTDNVVALEVQETITVNTSDVPEDIVEGSIVDILQMDAGHSTLNFDVILEDDSVSLNSITFTEDQLPDTFVVGDYICAQYECIVPQIPTDLHNLLAERTCARVLEALGDKDGLSAANAKIGELEFKQSVILDNRAEGSPMKVVNRTGLLHSSRTNFGRRTT